MTQVASKVRTGYRAVDNQVLIYDASRLDDAAPEFFDHGYWQQQDALVGEAPGRGTTFFVRFNDTELALRHYMRGGSVGRLIRDSYYFRGITRTRPWSEWHLLMQMYNQGLPVSRPVAARLTRRGLGYRADLVTERIKGASAWQDWILQGSLHGDDWVALGKLIKYFHNAGVYHHDLNVRNILRTESGQLYLIDFDKSCFRKPGVWQRANLSRLQRSILKMQKQHQDLHIPDGCWGQLLQGYASAA